MICERVGGGGSRGGGGDAAPHAAGGGDALMVQDVWPGNRKTQRGPNVRRGDAFTLCSGKRKAGVLHVADGADLDGLAAEAAASGGGSDCRDFETGGMVRLRMLTPVECERLQGLPDDHTRWGADGTELSDTRRYNLVGRAVPPPAVRAIASRIAAACGLGGGGDRGVAGA